MFDIAVLPYSDAKRKKALVRTYRDYGAKAAGDLKKLLPALLARVEQLHEFNPMLGHRGCRHHRPGSRRHGDRLQRGAVPVAQPPTARH
jgi:hypothetical protein